MGGARCPTCGRGGQRSVLSWILTGLAVVFLMWLVVAGTAWWIFGARSDGGIGASQPVQTERGR